jgi:AbrB family looped-hinge helix DNA binding protein
MRITERGQLTIPKKLRDQYGICPATELDVLPVEEGLLIVKRLQASPFRRFRGIANAKGIPRRTDKFLTLVRDGR